MEKGGERQPGLKQGLSALRAAKKAYDCRNSATLLWQMPLENTWAIGKT